MRSLVSLPIKFMTILDGRKLSQEILEGGKREIASLPFMPVFCDVMVGDNPVSKQYVGMKARNAEKVGIRFHRADFSASITTLDLVKEINILNKMENICGIIVQLPLPVHLDRAAVLDSIDPRIDVDCLGKVASEKFYN